MWFRNLQLYRLGRAFGLSAESLDRRLRNQAFQGCSRMDLAASGWVPPLGRHGEQLVHAANGYFMICSRKAEKIIPASVVKQLLDDRVAEVEAAESRDVYRREKLRMKDEIMVDLLPRALTRHTDLFAYIDTRAGYVVVDTPTSSRAEDLISNIRSSLGSFKATPVQVKRSCMNTMTGWLKGERLPRGLELGDECELAHPDPSDGVVNCKHQDLSTSEVRNHIKGGKFATRLAIRWKERLSCVLHDDLSIRRLRFEDVISEAEGDTDDDDPASRFDLDFSVMTLELADFLPQLFKAFGGEETGEQAA